MVRVVNRNMVESVWCRCGMQGQCRGSIFKGRLSNKFSEHVFDCRHVGRKPNGWANGSRAVGDDVKGTQKSLGSEKPWEKHSETHLDWLH